MLRKHAMIIHAIYMAKRLFLFENLESFFGEVVSVLKYLIPILMALITILIYVSVLPLSILAVVFTFINRKYDKRLPARSLTISSAICWMWLALVVLLR